MKKVNQAKRLIPAYLLNETEKAIITENYNYHIVPISTGGKIIRCLEFEEDAFDVLDNIESHMLLEADMSDTERRGLATRIATVAFLSVRELGYINGNNLIEIGKSLKAVGRVVALAAVCGLAVLDTVSARRLIPLIRAI